MHEGCEDWRVCGYRFQRWRYCHVQHNDWPDCSKIPYINTGVDQRGEICEGFPNTEPKRLLSGEQVNYEVLR